MKLVTAEQLRNPVEKAPGNSCVPRRGVKFPRIVLANLQVSCRTGEHTCGGPFRFRPSAAGGRKEGLWFPRRRSLIRGVSVPDPPHGSRPQTQGPNPRARVPLGQK